MSADFGHKINAPLLAPWTYIRRLSANNLLGEKPIPRIPNPDTSHSSDAEQTRQRKARRVFRLIMEFEAAQAIGEVVSHTARFLRNLDIPFLSEQ